jgi:hypothetical protein
MMWTQGKSKTLEHSDEFKKIRIKYNKILSIIKSCTTGHHIDCCSRIIRNFEIDCIKSRIHRDVYMILVKNLKEYTKLKLRSIRIT